MTEEPAVIIWCPDCTDNHREGHRLHVGAMSDLPEDCMSKPIFVHSDEREIRCPDCGNADLNVNIEPAGLTSSISTQTTRALRRFHVLPPDVQRDLAEDVLEALVSDWDTARNSIHALAILHSAACDRAKEILRQKGEA